MAQCLSYMRIRDESSREVTGPRVFSLVSGLVVAAAIQFGYWAFHTWPMPFILAIKQHHGLLD